MTRRVHFGAWHLDEQPPVALSLRALGLGDLLTALPALRAVAAAHPVHRHLLACPLPLRPLALLTDAVDDVVPARPLRPFRVPPPAVAFNLHGCGPQSHAVLRALRPARLVAFGCDDVEWREEEHEVDRWCRLLRENGIPADRNDLHIERPPGDPGTPERATVIHPGAASNARRWPAERFAAVARHELRGGRPVVITGSAGERELAERVADLAGLSRSSVAAGRTDLLGLARIVASAGRVVCGDTGVAHLATALRTPSVLLFGPVSPARWGPPPRPWHHVLWTGGTGDPHCGEPDPGLLEIREEEVIDALEILPTEAEARSFAAH
jgi:ADP-heptose:LPS heptosyltransferase